MQRKTGALIRCSMHMGSLVGSGNAETVQAMSQCGRYLGLAFQIRDDYLGVWGCEEETGKAIGNDLRRKKNSLPLVYAMEKAGGAEREQIQSIYAKEEVDDRDVASMMDVLEQLGVSNYVQMLAQKQADLAQEAAGERTNYGARQGGDAGACGVPFDPPALGDRPRKACPDVASMCGIVHNLDGDVAKRYIVKLGYNTIAAVYQLWQGD